MSIQSVSEVPREQAQRTAAFPTRGGRHSVEAWVGGYRAVSELLREPPSEALFLDAKALLRGFGSDVEALGALREALEHTAPSELKAAWRDSQPLIQLACGDSSDPERLWAFVAAEVSPSDRRLYELEALSGMGDIIANAAQLGRKMLAEAASARRRAFLAHHGTECLGGLAHALEQEGAALYQHVGRALAALLEVERSEEQRSPSSVPLAKCP